MRASAVLTIILAAWTSAGAETAAGDSPSWIELFNGRDLSGWFGLEHVDPSQFVAMTPQERMSKREENQPSFERHWTVEDGELVNDGQGPYATTEREWGDIELELEYRTVAGADSGVYLRMTPQVQIWDTTEAGGKWAIGADKGSGGLWNNRPGTPGRDPLIQADRPFGEWNRLRIIQVGARTTVWLNGQKVVDHAIMENYWDRARPLRPRGHIQLQTHGGEIGWRGLRVREIGSDEANTLLGRIGDEDYVAIFNGRDLEGWAGATANYEVQDGALLCSEGRGGVLRTVEEYEDFTVRLEFRLPPAGNNGLAIRYPGTGDAAYDGFCELQVLDDGAAAYTSLDPRQFHGSAYGLVAAHRGYLRPPGEWNFQEVTVQGSQVRVELNGTMILDADLSLVSDFLKDRPHPGLSRTRGFFGFAGHNDPVRFRHIRVKRL